MFLSASSFVVLFGCAAALPRSTSDPVVDLGYVKLAGNGTDSSFDFFGGIPYAKPPVGKLRFAAPEPVDTGSSQTRTLNVTAFGTPCPQYNVTTPGSASEDCLFINIYSPKQKSAKKNLPVAVFIHGGGFTEGNAQSSMQNWVSLSNNSVIGITLQYRLGALGFLAPPASPQDVKKVLTLNNGLLDQRLALRWIHKHISKFGGDPKRVTIIGQSAGGSSVAYHLAAYGGKKHDDLYQAAVLQSPYFVNDPPFSGQYSKLRWDTFINGTNCTGTTLPKTVDCLRNSTWENIIQADSKLVLAGVGGVSAFAPTFDGDFVPDELSNLFLEGKFKRVPVIAGAVKNDGVFTDATVNATTFNSTLSATYFTYDNTSLAEIAGAYSEQSVESSGIPAAQASFARLFAAEGDSNFRCTGRRVLESVNKYSNSQLPSYSYQWNVADKGAAAQAAGKLGLVTHSSEVYYEFAQGNVGIETGLVPPVAIAYNASEKALSDQFLSYLTSFVISHNPNSAKQASAPTWPAFTQTTPQRLAFQFNSTVETISDSECKRCDFWDSLVPTQKIKAQ